MTIIQKHIDNVRVGDIVIHNGVEKTVGTEDLKSSSFMGKTLFGDSYKLGRESVTIIQY